MLSYMKNNIILSVIVFALAAFLFSRSMFENNHLAGQEDWDQFIMWNAVPHKTIMTYQQFPLWNPYVNGGNVMLAHPHSPFLSPFFIFVLIFGPVMGLKVQITVHLFIGLCGMFLLARHLGIKGVSAYLSAFIFMGCAMFPLHLTEGHTEWLSMAFVPWFFLYYLKCLDNPKHVMGAIIALSLILLNGSVDVFNILMVFIMMFACLTSLQKRRFFPAKLLAVILGGTFLLCAVKLIPMLDFLGQNPRLIEENSGVTLKVLFHMLLNPDQGILDMMDWVEVYRMGLAYDWHEYGAYIGYIPLLLCFIGSVMFFEKHWPLICSGLITFVIAMGSGSLFNLWAILHRFPFYDSLTVPSRFMLGFIFYLSIISGLTFFAFEQYVRQKSKQHKNYFFIIPAIIVVLVAIDLYESNSSVFKNAFSIEPKQLSENIIFAQRYRQVLFYDDFIANSSIYPIFLSNAGIIDAYEVVHLDQGKVKALGETGYRGEFYLDQPDGEITQDYFSPNELKFTISLKKPNVLMINQNYHPGWKAEINSQKIETSETDGLISVLLPQGDYRLKVYYLPETFLIGLMFSLSFIVLSAVIIFQNKTIPFLENEKSV